MGESIILAVDPGATGGFAWIEPFDGEVRAASMKKVSADNYRLLRSIILGTDTDKRFAVVEQVTGFIGEKEGEHKPGSRMFSFGKSTGEPIGALKVLDFQFKFVRPMDWQRALQIKKPKKIKQDQWKRDLRDMAQGWFPDLNVTLATSDALILLRYAEVMQTFRGVSLT